MATLELVAENPHLTEEELHLIKSRIETNTETAVDYKKLDSYLSAVRMGGYILKIMNSRGYYSYEIFVLERRKPSEHKKDSFTESIIVGGALECISILERFLKF